MSQLFEIVSETSAQSLGHFFAGDELAAYRLMLADAGSHDEDEDRIPSDLLVIAHNPDELVVVDDGQSHWVARTADLLTEATALGWTLDGDTLAEPATEDEDEDEAGEAYATLCRSVRPALDPDDWRRLDDDAQEWVRERAGRMTATAGQTWTWTPAPKPAVVALRAWVADSGITAAECARVLGRDERTMRRWLAGAQDVPDTLAQQVARLRVTAVDDEGVHLTYRR